MKTSLQNKNNNSQKSTNLITTAGYVGRQIHFHFDVGARVLLEDLQRPKPSILAIVLFCPLLRTFFTDSDKLFIINNVSLCSSLTLS